MKHRLSLPLFLLAVGCATEPSGPPPEIAAVSVAPNPTNVLAAVITAETHYSDSLRVLFHLRGEGPGADSTTPAFVPVTGTTELPVLGLLPDRAYVFRVAAYGVGGQVLGDSLELTTGSLPEDLPHYATTGTDPLPGYVVFAAGKYGLVIDNTGRVVWYHRFRDGPGLNFMAQSNGRYAARPLVVDPSLESPWVEVDPSGTVTRFFGCALGLVPRFHDLIRMPDDSYWIMCDETRTLDLSGMGGVAQAHVMGTDIQHLSASGELLFQWSPFDHFAITDLAATDRSGSSVNWTHGNALAVDRDGNLLVSFRSLSEITKISTTTGEVLWRMGGISNQFRFVGTSTPAFARQHGLRLTAEGRLILIDNSGDPGASYAERYRIDAATRTAWLEDSHLSSPPTIAVLGGSTQDLPGGRTLVAFGNGNRVEEYDASGVVRWRIDGNPGYVFRAQRILSLYRPGVGTAR
jgi:hypothetical protein